MRKETLDKYISGEASENDNIEIMKWLEENPANEKELLSRRKIHNISIWNGNKEMKLFSKQKQTKKEFNTRRLVSTFSKVAAVFILCFIAYNYFSGDFRQGQIKMNSVEVPIGEQTELVLADGTKVWLNSKTVLRFPEHFSGNNRTVEIDGEGYFDVVKDKRHPFIVETPKYDIKVLGTIFYVKAYSAQEKFTAALLEGAIELSDKDQNQLFSLEPQEMVSDKNGALEKSTFDDFNQFLWKDGIISFNNESFEDIIDVLEKYYDVSITINDSIQDYRITGKFRIEDGVEHILNVLQLNYKFQYKTEKADAKNILIF